MEFICPECEHTPYPTLKGWKRHMTAVHSGFSPDQLAAASGGSKEGAQLAGGEESSLADAIENMPTVETREPAAGSAAETPQLSKEQRAAAKRIKARFDALRDRISSDIPDQVFQVGGVTMTDTQRKMLKESIETSFEVFGVDFEVQPWNLTIRSPFMILLYPLIVIAWIVISAIMKQKAGEEGEKPDA